jgi:hypothetical protein
MRWAGSYVLDSNQVPTTPAEIADAAVALLKEQGGGPLALARLGQLVAKRYQISIRAVLGSKPLSQVLRDTYGDKLHIEGDGPDIEVALSTSPPTGTKRRYDAAVFSAFSKPLAQGARRWLRTSPPFSFKDLPDTSSDPDAREVSASLIVPDDSDRPQRIKKIEESIALWATANGVEHETLLRPLRLGRDVQDTQEGNAGLAAIRSLLAAIPPAERKDFNLSLDLLAKLIGQ